MTPENSDPEKEPDKSEEEVPLGQEGESDSGVPLTKKFTKEEIEELKRKQEELRVQINQAKNFKELYDILNEYGHIQTIKDLEEIRGNLENLLYDKKDKDRTMNTLENVLQADNEDLFKYLRIFFNDALDQEFKKKVMNLFKDEVKSITEKRK